LLERERLAQQNTALPPPCDAPDTFEVANERFAALDRYIEQLSGIQHETPLAAAVVRGGYALSAYRLSLLALLALIGDAESAEMRGRVAVLARLIAERWTPRSEPLARRLLVDEAFREEVEQRLAACGLRLLDNPYATHIALGLAHAAEEPVLARDGATTSATCAMPASPLHGCAR
jgi:hypothetical protein